MERTPKRYKELVALVEKYNKQYHEENGSDISDYEFDMMNKELKEIEAEHPEWAAADTPTKKVGGKTKREAGVNVTHKIPMLSIQDVFSHDDVRKWVREVKALHPDALFSVEHKIDGLSVTLRYEDGKLTLAETRGNGFVGEDVTLNSKVIPDVLHEIDVTEYLEIRGEVYMSHEDFDKFNEKQEELGRQPAANPRNLAAGTLRQLDPEITKERGLRMFIFNVQNGPEVFSANHTKGLDLLALKGIKVVYHRLCSTEEEIIEEIEKIGENRGELDFDIDGAVVKLEQTAYRKDFTAGSKYSPGHIAYKYPPEEKETELIGVDLAVGRTGKITVTGVLKPVRLCGTTVQRVTLHNQDFINEKQIGIGGTYLIFKSGEIIPAVKEMVKPPEQVYKIPGECPVCGQPVVREEGMADIKCINPFCPAVLVSSVSFFTSRDAMDIKGFGEAYVEALIKEGYIKNSADIYYLYQYRDELIEKGLIGKEKNTDKLLKAIEDSKNNDIDRLITGLGIKNIGKQAGSELKKHFKSIMDLQNASYDDLVAINDVGGISAKAIVDFFANEENRAILQRLEEAGVNFKSLSADEGADSRFAGLTFVITGTLPTMGRTEMEELIKKLGGKVSGSVSKKTNYVIAGENAGSKLTKANELGITVLSEEGLLDMAK